jgi:uncharacterized protein YjiS (DUF1127 family)
MTKTFEFARVTRILRTRLIEPVMRWHRCAAMVRQLRALDDRTLDDIGISRYRIPDAVAQAYALRLEEESVSVRARVHLLPFGDNDRRTVRADFLRSKAA